MSSYCVFQIVVVAYLDDNEFITGRLYTSIEHHAADHNVNGRCNVAMNISPKTDQYREIEMAKGGGKGKSDSGVLHGALWASAVMVCFLVFGLPALLTGILLLIFDTLWVRYSACNIVMMRMMMMVVMITTMTTTIMLTSKKTLMMMMMMMTTTTTTTMMMMMMMMTITIASILHIVFQGDICYYPDMCVGCPDGVRPYYCRYTLLLWRKMWTEG